jgi:hypothetical protein
VKSDSASSEATAYMPFRPKSKAEKRPISVPMKESHIIDYDALILEEKIGAGAYGQV